MEQKNYSVIGDQCCSYPIISGHDWKYIVHLNSRQVLERGFINAIKCWISGWVKKLLEWSYFYNRRSTNFVCG